MWQRSAWRVGFDRVYIGFEFRWGCLIFCYVFLPFGFEWVGFWIPMGWVLDFDGVWVGFGLVGWVGMVASGLFGCFCYEFVGCLVSVGFWWAVVAWW